MSLVVNHNLMASNVANNLNTHYSQLATSTQRLSTGLRINSAADDAAGLAIRELQRADISALHQGVRNANDAISLIQTADGALAVIDEKLIRMKELAEQAATGTYDSTQRLMIDSEFQQMAAEINRIANATDFNGIHLLNGNLSGAHDGSGLTSTGEMKIHFGSGNDSAEDYYYINIGDCTIAGLGLGVTKIKTRTVTEERTIIREKTTKSEVEVLSNVLKSGVKETKHSGIVGFAKIPIDTKNLNITLYDRGDNDSLQIFNKDGIHIVGTELTGNEWNNHNSNRQSIESQDDANKYLITKNNGFNDSATYNGTLLNGTGSNITYNVSPYYQFDYNGMTIRYSGDGNENNSGNNLNEYLSIDDVKEDLLLFCIGNGSFDITAKWESMPDQSGVDIQQEKVIETIEKTIIESYVSDEAISIETQEHAQQALLQIDKAISVKDRARAHLGAMQNRLENTITNITTQAENLQASESRISDVDVATEMTNFVRNQILTQSAVAMLSQANSMPQMAMQIIGG